MGTRDAIRLLSDFASLQGRLVRKFLDEYDPKDRERFRDVPNGTLSIDGRVWMHQRHGAGVAFVSSDKIRVNAHVAMAEHPEAIDGGRLFEYLESLGLTSVVYNGNHYGVTKPDIDRMVGDMALSGLLRLVVTQGRFPHQIYELRRLVDDGDGSEKPSRP